MSATHLLWARAILIGLGVGIALDLVLWRSFVLTFTLICACNLTDAVAETRIKDSNKRVANVIRTLGFGGRR